MVYQAYLTRSSLRTLMKIRFSGNEEASIVHTVEASNIVCIATAENKKMKNRWYVCQKCQRGTHDVTRYDTVRGNLAGARRREANAPTQKREDTIKDQWYVPSSSMQEAFEISESTERKKDTLTPNDSLIEIEKRTHEN